MDAALEGALTNRDRIAALIRGIGREPLKATFKWLIDVSTLLASVAGLVTLILLLRDRPTQENVAAWQLLQSYLSQKPRPGFNEGQVFALEALNENRQSLDSIDAQGITLTSAKLHGLIAYKSNFQGAKIRFSDISGSLLFHSNFQGAVLESCDLENTDFDGGSLVGARLDGSYFKGAQFDFTDVSDLNAVTTGAAGSNDSVFDADAFKSACYRTGHPPRLPEGVRPPADPQGRACTETWTVDCQGDILPCWPQ